MPAEQSRRGLGPQGNWAEWVRAETGPKVQKPTLGALTVSFRGSELKARLQLIPEWPWAATYCAGKGLHFLTCRVGMTGGVKQDRGQHFANPPVLCRRAGVNCAASRIFPCLACMQSATLSFTKHRPSTFSCEPHGTHLGQIPTHLSSYCPSPPGSTEISSQRGRGAGLRAAKLA